MTAKATPFDSRVNYCDAGASYAVRRNVVKGVGGELSMVYPVGVCYCARCAGRSQENRSKISTNSFKRAWPSSRPCSTPAGTHCSTCVRRTARLMRFNAASAAESCCRISTHKRGSCTIRRIPRICPSTRLSRVTRSCCWATSNMPLSTTARDACYNCHNKLDDCA